ncbi:aspartate/glutamate racemase family protein [Sporosarcina sp. FSL K6-1522]|uniref:aspartate/glutamate racemase family protein n=1 Tax=Sporosarcina sp. FSL K6-1522 TaxID=2921554 RepID=UPI003159C0E4
MKVKVILPITSTIFNEEVVQEFEFYASPDTEIGMTNLSVGPESIESEYDEALCLPDFLAKAIAAEEEGYDAVISDCFADPGVKAAREVLSIPVIGPGEASMLYASSLASSFSVVTVLPNVISMIKNVSKLAGLDCKLASVRYVSIPVLEVQDKERLVHALYAEMVRAIEEDHAHALVLGCTGFLGVASELQERLKDAGYEVPVIDPAFASLQLAESLVTMKVKQSRLTYMTPPSKKRTM